MSVIRVEKNRNYTVIHNEFLRNKELSLKSKGLLSLILSLPDDWQYSINGLVSICKENITAVRNSLKELESHGYVVIEKTKNERGHFIYNYTIYETPVDSPPIEKPTLDDVGMVKQPVAKQPLENHRQLNKDILSTEKEVLNNNLYILDERLTPEISMLFKEYLEMREEIEMPVTVRGLQTLVERLEELSNGNTQIQKLMLQNATMNQWKNLFRPSDKEIEAYSKALVESLRSFYGL